MALRLVAIAVALVLSPAASASRMTNVHVYFVSGEHGVAVDRAAAPQTPAGGALRSLLAGPTASERRHGLSTAVPRGTRVLGLTISDGVARADLSRRFASGGGSASMRERLGQLVYTLTAIRGVHAVELRLEGKRVSVFSGEGLILRQPLARESYPEFVRG